MSKNISSLKGPRYLPNKQRSLSPTPNKLAEKSRLGKSIIAQNTAYKRQQNQQEFQYMVTQKKPSHFNVQKIIEQNRYLMSQNSQLNQILNERSQIIVALQRKLQQQITQQVLTLEQIQIEKNKFIEDFNRKNRDNSYQMDLLRREIQNLQKQKIEFQNIKNCQIQELNSQLLKQNKKNIDSIHINHSRNIQLMKIQIDKLASIIEARDNQIQQLSTGWRNDCAKYKQEINILANSIEELNHQKKIELSQQKVSYQNQILNVQKSMNCMLQQTKNVFQIEVKRLRNQLTCRNIEAQQLDHVIDTARIQKNIKNQEMEERQTILRKQISDIEQFYKRSHFNQIQKVKNINHTQVQILQKCNQNNQSSWKIQNKKLSQLNDKKNQQIKQLYYEISLMREQYNLEVAKLQALIAQLRQKMNSTQLANKQQEEMFKIKVSQLRHADLSTLKLYYQNQLNLKTQDIINLQQILKQTRQKLHIELQQKLQNNKQHEMDLDQLRIKIAQLELQISISNQQQRQQTTNLGSQMQLTSMALIRQTQQKQRYSQFNETQKKKLQQIIKKKDEEIQNLQQKIALLKKNNAQQVQGLRSQIQSLEKINDQLNGSMKRQKVFYQKQIQRKDAIYKQSRQSYQNQILKIKEECSNQFKKTVQELTHDKKQLQVQIRRLLTVEKGLKQELSRFRQHKQQIQMERDIAHSQEKNRLAHQKQSTQISLKTYYEKKIANYTREIELLKQQLLEKEADLRNSDEKVYKLQKKIAKLMQSQDRLRDVEQKVLALGQENNLVKNLNQMMKSRQLPRK